LLHQVFPKHILKNISQGRGNFGFRASKYVINQGIKLVLSPGFLQNGYLLIASQFQGLDLWIDVFDEIWLQTCHPENKSLDKVRQN